MKDGERRQLARASRHAEAPSAAPEPDGRALLLCDGGSRGNPGPAAAAAVLLAPDGEVVAERAVLIGHATAARTEYHAILLGLELAQAHDIDLIEVRSDSQLAIAALDSGTPVAGDLAPVVRDVRAAAQRFTAVRWCWHPRSLNDAADSQVRALLWPAG